MILYIYNKVWCAYYKDTTIPIVKLAQTIKMPVTTVRKYLYKIKLEDLVPKHGKIGLATIDKDIIKVRKEIAKYEAVGKDYVAKKVGSKYIVSKKEEV